jgi:ACT domain-containing protein
MKLYFPQSINYKMKFKNSIFEERFNEYWDNKVIALDMDMRKTSLGLNLHDRSSNIAYLIETFQQNVLNILLELDSHTYMFEDKDYLQEYRNKTIQQAIEYLYFYASVFSEYKDISSEFLKTLGIKSFLDATDNVSI